MLFIPSVPYISVRFGTWCVPTVMTNMYNNGAPKKETKTKNSYQYS